MRISLCFTSTRKAEPSPRSRFIAKYVAFIRVPVGFDLNIRRRASGLAGAMSSDEDEGDGRRVNRYESDDEGDVEGTFDEDAWNDSRTRNRGRTKEQAIYGIFGSDEDDDDDRTRGGRGAPVDYAAPMNFKSAGGGGAGLGAGETPTDMFADEHDDEHHRAPPTAGLGARGGIGSGAGLGSFAPQGGAGLGFGGFSKGSTITSTVENEETEARAPGLGSQGLGFGGGGAGLGFGGGGLGFAPASGGDGEDDGPAAGGLNPMDVDDNDSDDEDLLPSTFGQRYAHSIARDGPRNQKLFPPSSPTDTAGPIRPGRPSHGPCGHEFYPATT